MATPAKLEALLEKISDLDPDTRKILDAEGLGKKPSREEIMKAVWKHRPDLADLKTPPRKGKLTGPAMDDAVEIFEAVLKGGRKNILALIDMLREVDDGRDYRARYVLHALVTYCCRPDKGEQRDMIIAALCSQLGGKRPKSIQAFLLQQLQLCADGRIASDVGKLLGDEQLGDAAAATLLAVGAVDPLRAALPRMKGRAKLAVLQNLAVAGDPVSAGAMTDALRDSDSDVRLAAAAGLARIGKASAVGPLTQAADAEGTWERIKMAQACLVLAEKLLAADRKSDAKKLYTYLRDTRAAKGERHVRDLAANALATM